MFRFALVLTLACWMGPTVVAAEPGVTAATDGWTELFDGKSLDGWRQLGGKAKYSVEDRAIVGTTVPNTPNSFLCTEKTYGDFILELEFKVHPELNSGVQIRSNSLPDYHNGRVHGYQVEIDPSDRGWTAGIYDEGRRGWLFSLERTDAARYAFKPNEWNHLRIAAVGHSIRTWLNGVPATDLVDDMTPSGFIALQVHGVGDRQDPIQVRWRKIRIKDKDVDLKSAAPDVSTSSPAGDSETTKLPVVPESAEVEKVADGFRFTEGPAPGRDGRVYFSDIPNERIHVLDPAGGPVAVHRENSGRANGLMFAPSGALIACEGGSRTLTRQVGKSISVLADRYDGKRLNSPNDLVLDGKGGIYFTDPRYGDRDNMEMEIEGVYYRPRRGELMRVIDDMQRPNGLTLSLDKKVLYVADNAAKTILSYTVKPDGSVTDGKLFSQLDLDAPGGGDGMSIDQRGNVYCAAQGHIWIWNPKGQQVAKIAVPENPSNCAFGGKDLQTLYITARTGLYRIRLNVAGARPY